VWEGDEVMIDKTYYQAHKEKLQAKARAYHWAHRETANARARANYQEHKEERLAYAKAYQQVHIDEVLAYKKSYYQANREEVLERVKANGKRIRDKVLVHYGSKCACCGETIPEFLTIDHINNDGASHRRKLLKSGGSLYRWIIKNNFPPDLQILCWNCNCSKGHYGICPHERIL
jgi:predicted restriction endonuclease